MREKTNSMLTPDEVKIMPLDEFEMRFGFRPKDALEKWGFAVLATRMNDITRAMFSQGVLDMPDLSSIVME